MKKILTSFLILLFPLQAFGAVAITFLESGSDATQGLQFYSSPAGAVTSDNTQSCTGPRSIKLASGAGPTQASVTSPGVVLSDSGTQISFCFRFDSLPSANAVFFNLSLSNGVSRFGLQLKTTGVLVNGPNGVTAVAGTKVLSANTWYRISLSYYLQSTTDFQVKVYVNGGLDSTVNSGTLQGVAWDRAFWAITTGYGANKNIWIDNVFIQTGGTAKGDGQPDVGDMRVASKRAFANGTTNGFTGTGAGSGYGSGNAVYVNQQPLSAASNVSLIGAGSAVTEEYNIENLVTGDANIAGNQIVGSAGWLFAKSTVGETIQIILNNVNTSSTTISTDKLFTAFASSGTYPAGSGKDIGIISDTSLTTLTLEEAGVLIAYKVPAFNFWQFWDF